MIYYASTKKEGAKMLPVLCNVPYMSPLNYITMHEVNSYLEDVDTDVLFKAVSDHAEIHAFALPSVRLYFYPDTLVNLIGDAYQQAYVKILAEMEDS